MTKRQDNLFARAYACLMTCDPADKVQKTKALQDDWLKQDLALDDRGDVEQIPVPGRPARPELVDPRKVPRRNFNSLNGRMILVHAIAHIEFNAINLALDAIYRFRDMPKQYYADWCRVAAEEAEHYTLLTGYLNDNGSDYGDHPAHNGLWEMAVKTSHDVLVRMALVPRVLEARGLDVTPSMITKLNDIGDDRLVGILEIIFADEIGHVKIGSDWFTYLCEQRRCEPRKTFIKLVDEYMQGASFGPFEEEARIKAGFTKEEMQNLMAHF
jgi:uncharacterized ferritin-like protein (DUF455 family)